MSGGEKVMGSRSVCGMKVVVLLLSSARKGDVFAEWCGLVFLLLSFVI